MSTKCPVHIVNQNLSAIINSAIDDLTYIPTNAKKLRKLACKNVNQLIAKYNTYIHKKTQILHISNIISSTSGYNNPSELIVTCSIIWLIKNTQTKCDEQMKIDFIIEFMFDDNRSYVVQHKVNGMKLIRIYDKIPKIYESGLYEVNDRATSKNSKIPIDLIQFII